MVNRPVLIKTRMNSGTRHMTTQLSKHANKISQSLNIQYQVHEDNTTFRKIAIPVYVNGWKVLALIIPRHPLLQDEVQHLVVEPASLELTQTPTIRRLVPLSNNPYIVCLFNIAMPLKWIMMSWSTRSDRRCSASLTLWHWLATRAAWVRPLSGSAKTSEKASYPPSLICWAIVFRRWLWSARSCQTLLVTGSTSRRYRCWVKSTPSWNFLTLFLKV